MQFGDRLKDYRLKKNLTQIEVAEKLNISRQSVSKWENNKAYPDIAHLKVLSHLYEVSIDALLGNKVTRIDIEKTTMSENHVDTDRIKQKMWFLLLLCLSVLIPFLGMIMSITVAIKNRKEIKYFGMIYLLCLMCFIVNVYECLLLFKVVFQG